MSEMEQTEPKKCVTCKYSWPHKIYDHGAYIVMCKYYLITKCRRGCPVGWCDKYEPRNGTEKKKRWCGGGMI